MMFRSSSNSRMMLFFTVLLVAEVIVLPVESVKASRKHQEEALKSKLMEEGASAALGACQELVQAAVQSSGIGGEGEGAAIEQANTILEGADVAGALQSCDNGPDGQNTVVVHLSGKVRGEIATKSRVPIQWILGNSENQLIFSVVGSEGTLKLMTEGLFAVPFEGLQVYADSGVASYPDTTWDNQEATMMAEAQAVYKYVEGQRTSNWKGTAQSYFAEAGGSAWGFLQDASHKVIKCWYTIREMTGYSVTVGSHNGPKAIYPMLLTKPMKITSFDFADYEGKGLRVAIGADLDDENHAPPVTVAGGQVIPAAQYFTEMHLEEKTRMLFNPAKFPGERAMAERFAESAMNYAAALASGNPEITAKNNGNQLEGGKVDRVRRFFKTCPGAKGLGAAKKGNWEPSDETYPCSGKVEGRVVWSLL